MPLSFQSSSHGNIAFGFFNIESDMLLLENYFFFADDFCEWLCQMSEQISGRVSGRVSSEKDTLKNTRFEFPAYKIELSNDIGDLMGAIHGVRYTGFIGETYKLFPFPDDPKLFKQNPDGFQIRKIVESLICDVAVETKIMFDFEKIGHVNIGPYGFDTKVFHELIQYVWKGGYPHWKDEIRPDYVLKMKTLLEKSSQVPFYGVFSSI